MGLVDEVQLHILPILLGEDVSLFAGLGKRIDLERVETSAFAGETRLRCRVRS
ncbi:dihydrofolate reductase family protein [Nonomuraea salmonea]|uniref:Dihydrofolate reductase family protein n=1 Tax=Nonomuraea salmonea TaxID=46181 RepID=A0ABV5P4R1_9ACTN